MLFILKKTKKECLIYPKPKGTLPSRNLVFLLSFSHSFLRVSSCLLYRILYELFSMHYFKINLYDLSIRKITHTHIYIRRIYPL